MMKTGNHSPAKRLLTTVAALAMLLTLPLTAALGDDPVNSTTEATVTFTEGKLEFGEVGLDPLNLDFGVHSLPVSQATYPSEKTSGSHVLGVDDARSSGGQWNVTVSLSKFAPGGSGSTSIDALIHFASGQVSAVSGNTPSTVTLSDVSLPTNNSPVEIFATTGTSARDGYRATWLPENITLDIADEEAQKLEEDAYVATLTWTLSDGPGNP